MTFPDPPIARPKPLPPLRPGRVPLKQGAKALYSYKDSKKDVYNELPCYMTYGSFPLLHLVFTQLIIRSEKQNFASI